MKRLWAKYRQSRDEDLEELCTTNALVVAAVAEAEASSGSRPRGSQPGRAPNEERFRESRGKDMIQDYFVERPVFSEEIFRTRYRMSHNLFNRISSDLCGTDPYWVQKSDAAGKVGLLPQQKLTCSLRMLAYGAGADQCGEYCRMAKSTSIQALKRFTRGIVNLYAAEYLRAPNPADLRRLLTKAEKRGFPGMIGSIDCMHWQWKNCPTGWAGEYSGRKHVPTIILEAVASYDTWIWHAFFGMPGSCNDLNVLAKSPLFDDVTTGRAPRVQFQANNRNHKLGYYLADGIYPQWATFIKSIPRPTRPKDLKFSQAQEGYRKDVERCFGILQSRFSIIRGAARGWERDDLHFIMLTCIILHNMIIEDERPDDSDEDLESDEEEDNNMKPRLAQVWEGPTGHDFDPVGRDGYYFNGFMDRYDAIRSANSHSNLQGDLIEHFWNVQGNMEI
ncbi:putative nuclease HARBI1 [Rosa chinensis]|uniref:putative nuclease HARBI1 n=1 Tax=Rosa chinensis TaxID=74649 RepID=UPI000D09033E|nr:putative nuclease HARBI1 [Rosa chinensis]